MADSGFIDRALGLRVIDDDTPATRIPKRHGMQTDYVLLKGGEYRKVIVEMAKTELEKLDSGPLKNAVTRYRFKKTNAP
jgi:hypothetical protein